MVKKELRGKKKFNFLRLVTLCFLFKEGRVSLLEGFEIDGNCDWFLLSSLFVYL